MTVHIAYLAEEQSGGTPGVRVVEPPSTSHQAQRGNFYAVVALNGPDKDIPALTERLLSTMQRTYYSTKGTQSQVLTETIRSAKVVLQNENIRTQVEWRAGVICIGLMNDRLALAGMGDAFAFVTTDGGDVNVYPPERLDAAFHGEDDPFVLWPLHRQKIEAGGAVLAGSGRWLEMVSPRTLAGATAYVDADNCADAADGLREQAGVNDLPGIVLVFDWGDEGAPAPPDTPPPPSASTGAPPANPARSERGGSGLPTAMNASPPVTGAPPDTVSRKPPAAEISAAGAAYALASSPFEQDAPPDTVLRDSSIAPNTVASTPTAQPPGQPGEPPTSAAAPAPESNPGSTAQIAAVSASLAAGAKFGLARAKTLVGSMLPDRTSQPAGATAEPPQVDDNDMRAMAAAAAALAQTTAHVTPPARFAPPPRASGGRARLFITVAVIILLLVPAIVAGMYWQKGASNRAQAQSLLDLAGARLLSGRDALDQNDQTTARALLTEANNYAVQAEEILGRTAQSGELLKQIKAEQQQVMGITPLYGLTAPLTTFPADAEPQRLLVVDQDIYVLDTGRGQVTKYRLDPGGETLIDEGQVVLKEGDTVGGAKIGPLVDIAWQLPIPGYEDKSSLMLLDANNQVFRYNQVDGPSLMSFGDNTPWKKATQLEVFSDRLYVADEGANKIYRYAPGTYTDPPENWFLDGTQVSLQGIKSMRIDGDIWLLFDDGKVVRYHAGEQVPYGLDDSVALPTDPVDMYVSQSASDNSIYLADAADERILFFDKATGKFQGQFQAAEGTPLRGLRGLFIDEARGTLFILTDEALYSQHMPR